MEKIALMTFLLGVYFSASAQDMKGMDLSKKDKSTQAQPLTYTCSMHPEIHATKPGNCPKCGMKLMKERPKKLKQPSIQKHNGMQIPKDTAKKENIDMDNMKVDNMKWT